MGFDEEGIIFAEGAGLADAVDRGDFFIFGGDIRVRRADLNQTGVNRMGGYDLVGFFEVCGRESKLSAPAASGDDFSDEAVGMAKGGGGIGYVAAFEHIPYYGAGNAYGMAPGESNVDGFDYGNPEVSVFRKFFEGLDRAGSAGAKIKIGSFHYYRGFEDLGQELIDELFSRESEQVAAVFEYDKEVDAGTGQEGFFDGQGSEDTGGVIGIEYGHRMRLEGHYDQRCTVFACFLCGSVEDLLMTFVHAIEVTYGKDAVFADRFEVRYVFYYFHFIGADQRACAGSEIKKQKRINHFTE